MLVIDISVNREVRVEEIGIVRVEGGTEPDDMNKYEFGFVEDGRLTGILGSTRHRYGDSGLKLSAKVLGILNDQDMDGEIAQSRRTVRERKEAFEHFEAVSKALESKT